VKDAAESGPLLVGGPGRDGRPNEAFIRDLRLWALSEKLPPECDWNALVQTVELAEQAVVERDRIEDLEAQLEEALEDNKDLERQVEDLERQVKDLEK
jgi:uncharacterized protein YlxW (UPF0749 family)